MTPDKINAVSVIRRLLESVNRRQTQMDDIWRERRAILEQTLELRVFEKALQKVMVIFLSPSLIPRCSMDGEEFLAHGKPAGTKLSLSSLLSLPLLLTSCL